MKASAIISRVGTLLLDESNVRWPKPELVMWIGDALQQIVSIRPDAHPEVRELTLVAGADQTLPADATRLLDITHNIVTNPGGQKVPGKAITLTQREVLDRFNRNWKGGKKSVTVQHFMQEARDPKRFHVSPPTNGDAKVSAILATIPTAPTDENSDLDIDPRFTDAIVAYVMFRAYSKDAEHTARASDYATLFASLMGGDRQASIAFGPNQNSQGGKPNPVAISQGGVS